MTVLGQHLYSTPTVALRELVQNAHDSLVRRRMEDRDWTGGGRIQISGDLAKGILRITDQGAGLTEGEIHGFLATIGVGYTRTLRERSGSEELIGLFGLGFLSAFVLAEEVILTTSSYQEPHRGWCYRSCNGQDYHVAEVAARPEVGTEVVLHLRATYQHLAGPGALARILGKYCALMPDPIYIEDASTPLNDLTPPWHREPGEPVDHPVQYRRKCMAFAERFEDTFAPLCTLPVEPTGASDAIGLLWIQDGSSYATSDNRNLSIFVRGMLLDDDARDLIPAWAGFVGGVIESKRLTPTASREDIQKDDVYHAVRSALKEALVEGLSTLSKQDDAAWRRVLTRHNEALLGAALCDPRLFSLLADSLWVPTSQGDLPVRALMNQGNLHVALGGGDGFEDMLFRALQIPVARGDRYAVMSFLREWVVQRGGRLIEVGTQHGNRQLFAEDELPQEDLDWLTAQLGDGELLIPAHFAPLDLPLVVVPDREAELKQRLEADEADERISVAALKLARAFTARIDGTTLTRLYVNLDNPAVQAVLEARRKGANTAVQAARTLWALKVLLSSRSDEGRLNLKQALAQLGQATCQLVNGTGQP